MGFALSFVDRRHSLSAPPSSQSPATVYFTHSQLIPPPVILKMKKGLHPQMQWMSYVTPSGRLINFMMTKIHSVGKVYHLRAKRQIAATEGQIAKFNRRYGLEKPDDTEQSEKNEK
ncbi:hypothetical protein V6N13_134087 [Hibiscus sabdariffa]|uniref:Uncharacterized protein n=3 Tax=Hibiscus sabdariffa TaxID=183260 RepID=A0ABR1ZG87_9ROSI